MSTSSSLPHRPPALVKFTISRQFSYPTCPVSFHCKYCIWRAQICLLITNLHCCHCSFLERTYSPFCYQGDLSNTCCSFFLLKWYINPFNCCVPSLVPSLTSCPIGLLTSPPALHSWWYFQLRYSSPYVPRTFLKHPLPLVTFLSHLTSP